MGGDLKRRLQSNLGERTPGAPPALSVPKVRYWKAFWKVPALPCSACGFKSGRDLPVSNPTVSLPICCWERQH